MSIPKYELFENGLRVYKGSLTLRTVIEQNIKIAKAFPELNNDWFELFNERIKENRFTDERLIAAVNKVIDSFTYGKVPNIANFISFNKSIELLTEREMTLKADKEGITIRKSYELIEFENKVFYTLIGNADKYKLKKWIPENHPAIGKVTIIPKKKQNEKKKETIKSISEAFEDEQLKRIMAINVA